MMRHPHSYRLGVPARVGLLVAGLMVLGAGAVFAQDTPPLPPGLAIGNNSSATLKSVSPSSYWTDLGDAAAAKSLGASDHENLPQTFRTLAVDFSDLAKTLADAPHQKNTSVRDGLEITLPLPDGSFQRFRVVESPMISDEVQAMVPELRTYLAQGVDDPAAVLRLSTSSLGFQAYGRTSSGTLWIDPYTRDDTGHVISAYRHDFDAPTEGLDCQVDGADYDFESDGNKAVGTSGDQLRTYRMIVTLTGEYSVYFGGTGPATTQAIVTMNRVNSVYQIDVAVFFNLVAVNAYPDPATDPFSNGAVISGTILNQNQATTDAIYGSGAYDIGHILAAGGGGGLAGLGVVCVNGGKARGGTGRTNPTGDPFDIDYVAHEVGHQMGGSHTFNGSTGSCAGGNRSPGNAYEPGSGSTIMAYAGICGVDNVQSNSDPYFHVRSLEQIIATRDASGCGIDTATGNTPPVADAGPDRTIPRGTPFWVRGSVSDPDPDAFTYTWEQYDLGSASPPTDPYGPLFRSFNPSGANYRYFPDNAQIFNGTSDLWEILPSVDRSLTLRFTVRDNAAGGGGVDDDELELTVMGNPFFVTAPNGGESFLAGQPVTVTWEVGGSVASDVVIYLVNSSGFEVLASSTANDGSESVLMPCGPTDANSWIWIEEITGSGNGVHVYDISNAAFTVTDGLPDFAPLQNGGWGDKVVVNSVASPALPTNLFGDSNAFIYWAYWNYGDAYGCGGFEFQSKIDERTVDFLSFPNGPGPGSGTAWGPAQRTISGGRHTIWLEMDPNNLLAESDETNNGYARQWVWLPAGLTNEATTTRSAPPERVAGSEFIPGGVTFYENTDGLRITSPGSTWRAAAISAFDGSDYDLKLFEASTGVEDGFTTDVAYSGGIGTVTDIVLINEQVVPAGLTYDLGITLYEGSANYIADYRHSGAPISLGTSLTGVSVGDLQIIDIGAFEVGPAEVGRNVLEIDNVSTSQPVTVLLFSPTAGYAHRFLAVSTTTVDASGSAFIDFNMNTPGTWAYVLVREALNGVAPFTYDVRVRPTPPDIAAAVLPGSHGSVVPQNDASIAVGDPVPAPAILNGDVGDSHWYFHVANNGPADADLWDIHVLRDGVNLGGPEWPFGLPGNTEAISGSYLFPIAVSGGRHTAGMFFDALDDFDELNEENNRFAEQWVWNPTQLVLEQSVTRATPPDPLGGWDDIPVGLTRELNVDGLRTPGFTQNGDNGFWGGFAATPGASGDVDLRLHAASTGAQNGFDILLETSNQPGSATEILLFDLDDALPPDVAYDVGMERVSGDSGYTAHATESIYLTDTTPFGQVFGPLVLGAGEIMGLYEFPISDVGGPDVALSIILENDAGGADLGLAVFGRTDGTGFYTLAEALPGGLADDNGVGENERVDLVLPVDSFFGVVVYKTNGTETAKTAEYKLRFFDPALSAVGDAPALVARIDNYPNPFNPQTSIDFTLERAGRAEVRIYDVHGKLVRTLEDGQLAAGKHTRVWQGRDNGGRQVASGVYMARFVHPDGVSLRRMVLLK